MCACQGRDGDASPPFACAAPASGPGGVRVSRVGSGCHGYPHRCALAAQGGDPSRRGGVLHRQRLAGGIGHSGRLAELRRVPGHDPQGDAGPRAVRLPAPAAHLLGSGAHRGRLSLLRGLPHGAVQSRSGRGPPDQGLLRSCPRRAGVGAGLAQFVAGRCDTVRRGGGRPADRLGGGPLGAVGGPVQPCGARGGGSVHGCGGATGLGAGCPAERRRDPGGRRPARTVACGQPGGLRGPPRRAPRRRYATSRAAPPTRCGPARAGWRNTSSWVASQRLCARSGRSRRCSGS